MHRIVFSLLLLPVLSCMGGNGGPAARLAPPDHDHPPADTVPKAVRQLLKYYPQVKGYENNRLLFSDGSLMLYDDGTIRNAGQLLDSPDIDDQFAYRYTRGTIPTSIPKNADPGRIRNEAFFKKIYGATPEAVRANLVEVTWCPKTVGQKILVTRINGVDEQVRRISAELDARPELAKYVRNIGGTFNWRLIKGTQRLSMHSFGMTMDINTAFSHYWQWDCKCTNEDAALQYRNSIPQAIVDIFEKHGFIWGGRWYHYDTMHFEYRPELMGEE